MTRSTELSPGSSCAATRVWWSDTLMSTSGCSLYASIAVTAPESGADTRAEPNWHRRLARFWSETGGREIDEDAPVTGDRVFGPFLEIRLAGRTRAAARASPHATAPGKSVTQTQCPRSFSETEPLDRARSPCFPRRETSAVGDRFTRRSVIARVPQSKTTTARDAAPLAAEDVPRPPDGTSSRRFRLAKTHSRVSRTRGCRHGARAARDARRSRANRPPDVDEDLTLLAPRSLLTN